MKSFITTCIAIGLVCFSGLTAADDGAKVLKRMTGGNTDNQLNVLPEDIGQHVNHAEHAFTDMLKFYVPAQAASGLVGSVAYCDIDNAPLPSEDCINYVEELDVARPLVNVFVYGPAVEVPDTPFAHSFMEAFAAVSLDDGMTWKTTNLSGAADLSSFTLGEDTQHTGGSGGGGHAAQADYPLLESAVWEDKNRNFGRLEVTGSAAPQVRLEIVNYTTGEQLFSLRTDREGEFDRSRNVRITQAPCMVAAVVDGVMGNPVAVIYADESPVNCVGVNLTEYPGGSYNIFHATAGNKTLVAWPSRFCKQGQPAYSFAWDGDDSDLNADNAQDLLAKREAVADLLEIDVEQDLYLTDLFLVGGPQRSIDFADEGYPQAGEVPFGCVWTARGVLLPGDDPRTDEVESSHMVWTKAERLTSGRRDPNRIEVKGVAGAGFVITWQEDPDGLRPGQGEGPGEGWSGAVAHDKTDVWYSFIPWKVFDLVEDRDDVTGEPVNIADHNLDPSTGGSGRPQVYVPMAVPMRLTNNEKCVPDVTTERFSYCNHEIAANYGLQDFCADVIQVPQGPTGAPGDICVNADGLPNLANTGSTRPRLSLQGYDEDGDGITERAWVVVAAEESKGLGRFTFLPDGTACEEVQRDDPNYNPDCTADIGKNQWYFSFDMGDPATSQTAEEPYGLVQNLVSQGNLLNQPEVDWRTGEFYPTINTSEMWDFGEYNFDLYNTEIARRSSLLVQGIGKAVASDNQLLAISSWKQGAMRQGGPADTMLRRIVVPCDNGSGIGNGSGNGKGQGQAHNQGNGKCRFEQTITNNPYAFTHVDCSNPDGSSGWILTEGESAYYPDGICLAPATNLSGVVPDECIDTDSGLAIDCPTVAFDGTTYGIGDTNPILQGYIQGEGNTMKVLTWHQCPSDGMAQDTSELEGAYTDCDSDNRTDDYVNLMDQSWYNPLDVSKGHRGFLDGDFVMFLYAWSPNWRLNAKGNDRYELYVRRSFDGGMTWTTLPQSFEASNQESFAGDGTVSCETYRSTVTQTPQAPEPHVCYAYPAGGNEQARNVTQHSRMRITTLDPRYAPTPASITETCIDDLALPDAVDAGLWSCDDTSEMDSDLRDPSRYFMVYETGDNTTVVDGEAEPDDLFYSRAESFGDDYVVWAETDSATADASICFPSDPHEDEGIIGTVIEGSGFCNEFDRMNAGGDTHSSEANLEANPDGSKMYGVWAQWVFEDDGDYESEVIESDAMARRIWWIDDYISDDPDLTWTLPGTNQPDTANQQPQR